MRSVAEISDLYGQAGVSEDATIIAYCRTGLQASFGYFLGRHLGRPVYIYDGSYIDWSSDPTRPVVSP
jgi:thiosulfate/3-mercaptopyruvate sulfurtransferase